MYNEPLKLKNIDANKLFLTVNCFAIAEKNLFPCDKFTMVSDNNDGFPLPLVAYLLFILIGTVLDLLMSTKFESWFKVHEKPKILLQLDKKQASLLVVYGERSRLCWLKLESQTPVLWCALGTDRQKAWRISKVFVSSTVKHSNIWFSTHRHCRRQFQKCQM